ncbi:hypothetical protein [Kineococcus sp. NPDC059986]|uniref:hypothetical protein n=1 Tax=Kineococcus sp. NPDC059986 TaxID=3155538 RepID=UPI00344F6146
MKWSVRVPTLWPLSILATLALVLAKVTDHLDWAWIWVLAPLWGCFALVLVFFVVLLFSLPLVARRLLR